MSRVPGEHTSAVGCSVWEAVTSSICDLWGSQGVLELLGVAVSGS